eukprot:g413.t1
MSDIGLVHDFNLLSSVSPVKSRMRDTSEHKSPTISAKERSVYNFRKRGYYSPGDILKRHQKSYDEWRESIFSKDIKNMKKPASIVDRENVRDLFSTVTQLLESIDLPHAGDRDEAETDDALMLCSQVTKEHKILTMGIHEIAKQILPQCKERAQLLAELNEYGSRAFTLLVKTMQQTTQALKQELQNYEEEMQQLHFKHEEVLSKMQNDNLNLETVIDAERTENKRIMLQWEARIIEMQEKERRLATEYSQHIKYRQDAELWRSEKQEIERAFYENHEELQLTRTECLEAHDNVTKLRSRLRKQEDINAELMSGNDQLKKLQMEVSDKRMELISVQNERDNYKQRTEELEKELANLQNQKRDEVKANHDPETDKTEEPTKVEQTTSTATVDTITPPIVVDNFVKVDNNSEYQAKGLFGTLLAKCLGVAEVPPKKARGKKQKKSKAGKAPKEADYDEVRSLISDVYDAKYEDNLLRNSLEESRPSLSEFCVIFFRLHYPDKREREEKIRSFFLSLKKLRHQDRWVQLFVDFLENTRSHCELDFLLYVKALIAKTPYGNAYKPSSAVNAVVNDYEEHQLCFIKATLVTRLVFRMFHFRHVPAELREYKLCKKIDVEGNAPKSVLSVGIAGSSASGDLAIVNQSSNRPRSTSKQLKKKSKRSKKKSPKKKKGKRLATEPSIFEVAEAFLNHVEAHCIHVNPTELRDLYGKFYHITGHEKKISQSFFLRTLVDEYHAQRKAVVHQMQKHVEKLFGNGRGKRRSKRSKHSSQAKLIDFDSYCQLMKTLETQCHLRISQRERLDVYVEATRLTPSEISSFGNSSTNSSSVGKEHMTASFIDGIGLSSLQSSLLQSDLKLLNEDFSYLPTFTDVSSTSIVKVNQAFTNLYQLWQNFVPILDEVMDCLLSNGSEEGMAGSNELERQTNSNTHPEGTLPQPIRSKNITDPFLLDRIRYRTGDFIHHLLRRNDISSALFAFRRLLEIVWRSVHYCKRNELRGFDFPTKVLYLEHFLEAVTLTIAKKKETFSVGHHDKDQNQNSNVGEPKLLLSTPSSLQSPLYKKPTSIPQLSPLKSPSPSYSPIDRVSLSRVHQLFPNLTTQLHLHYGEREG